MAISKNDIKNSGDLIYKIIYEMRKGGTDRIENIINIFDHKDEDGRFKSKDQYRVTIEKI